MTVWSSDQERPSRGDASADRRSGDERRSGERRSNLAPALVGRHAGPERRFAANRRGMRDRRAEETAQEHIRNALQLLASVAGAALLSDDARRDLDSAMLRLRFAVDRLESRG